MVTFASTLRPDTTMTGRLESRVHAAVWDVEEGRIGNSRWMPLRIPRIIPTVPSRDGPARLREATDRYRRHWIETLAQRSEGLERTLQRTRAPHRRWPLLRESALIGHFLETSDEQIRLDGPYGSGSWSSYRLTTPPLNGADKLLPKEFQTWWTYRRQLRMHRFHLLEGARLTDDRVPLETLARAPIYALDFETHNWRTIRLQEELQDMPVGELRDRLRATMDAYGERPDERLLPFLDRKRCIRAIERLANAHRDERLTVASFTSIDESYLITTLECGKSSIDVPVPGTGRTVPVRIITVADQRELVDVLNDLYAMRDPLISAGHNHLKFDYRKAVELAGGFFPGVDAYKPRQVSQAGGGFIVRTEISGRESLDASGFAQHYASTHNNRLDTVLEDMAGIRSGKTMTHGELFEKTGRAERGSCGDAEDILFYAAQDAMKSVLISRRLLREHLLLATAFDSSLARIDVTSKKSLATEYHERRRFETRGTLPMRPLDLQHSETAGKYEDFDAVRQMDAMLASRRGRRGLCEGHLVAFHPFAHAFEPMLARDPLIRAVYDAVRANEPKAKARLLRALTALAEYPLFRLQDESDQNVRTFEAEFGLPRGEFGRYRDRVRSRIGRVDGFLRQYEPINRSNELCVLPADAPVDALPSGVHLGTGMFLSGPPGRFASLIDGRFNLVGIADPASNKGERCEFEKAFYGTFLRRMVGGDARGALEYLVERARMLADGTLLREEVVYSRIAGREFTDYSIRARAGFIERIKGAGARKGDLVRYGYDPDALRLKFFGGPGTRGTVSEIVHWAFPFRRTDTGAQLLDEIYKGRGTPEHVGLLLSSVVSYDDAPGDESDDQPALF